MKVKAGIKESSQVTTVNRAITKQSKRTHLEPHMIQKLILQQTPQELVEAAKLNQPLTNNSIEELEKLLQDLNKQYQIRILVVHNIMPEAQAKACEYIHLLEDMIKEIQIVINNKRDRILSAPNTNVHAQWVEQQLIDLTTTYESKIGIQPNI